MSGVLGSGSEIAAKWQKQILRGGQRKLSVDDGVQRSDLFVEVVEKIDWPPRVGVEHVHGQHALRGIGRAGPVERPCRE